MDLSCIILSGDLELYVLGMLPEEEAQKISQLILIFPEVKEEVARVLASVENAPDTQKTAVQQQLYDKYKICAQDAHLVSLQKREPTLEDVFVELVGRGFSGDEDEAEGAG